MHSLKQKGLLTEEVGEIPSMAQKHPVCAEVHATDRWARMEKQHGERSEFMVETSGRDFKETLAFIV